MQIQLVQQTLWVRAVIAGPWQGQWAVWSRRTGRGCLWSWEGQPCPHCTPGHYSHSSKFGNSCSELCVWILRNSAKCLLRYKEQLCCSKADWVIPLCSLLISVLSAVPDSQGEALGLQLEGVR